MSWFIILFEKTLVSEMRLMSIILFKLCCLFLSLFLFVKIKSKDLTAVVLHANYSDCFNLSFPVLKWKYTDFSFLNCLLHSCICLYIL